MPNLLFGIPALAPLVVQLILLFTQSLPSRGILGTNGRTNHGRPARLTQAAALKLVSIRRDPDEHDRRIQKWVVSQHVTMGISAFILLYVVVTCSYLLLIRTPPIDDPMPLIGLLVFLALMAMLMLVNAFFSKRRLRSGESSHVAKSIEITVSGNREYLINQCLVALLNMDAGLTRYDAHTGLIEAELPRGRLIIKVESPAEGTERTIKVQSDSKLPTTWVDFGSNSGNISRFVKEFFLTQ